MFNWLTHFATRLLRPHRSRRGRPAPPSRARRPLEVEFLEGRLVPSVTANFQLVNDWGSGFQAAVTIVNDQATAIPNWRLEFDFASQISQIWNGVIASHVGTHYVTANAGYNSTIAANSSVTFGFLGTPGHVTTGPANYVLNGVPLGSTGTLPTLSIAGVTVTEGDTQDVPAAFTVTLSHSATQPVTVAFATRDGSAVAGADYVVASGTLTFNPGETSKSIPVSVRGDLLNEADEDFFVTLSNPVGATLATAEGRGLIHDNDPLPSLAVSDVTVQEPSPGMGTAAGSFHTAGNQILDAAGHVIRLAGVNWFGMETSTYAPHGLWARNYKDMMDQMKQLGFNAIRLPFSDQLFDAGSTPNGIDFAKNPDLQGLNGLGILDRIVGYAGQIGLRIVLDHHRSDAGAGAEGSGLWYTGAYPESRWIADWTMLASRYAGNPAVVGADLHNEPHGPAAWGTGSANDWRLAAERAGNAILAANPSWLILVEGVESGPSGSYWWGGNLSSAGAFPVRLNVAGRLVYSPHDYPASVYPQPWFSAANYPNNLPAVWDQNWGYLFRQGTAPVLLGEFGTTLQTASDQQWLDKMVTYLKGDLNGDGVSDLAPGQQGPSWTWWAWNPNSGDTGGILQDDWLTVQQAKVDKLNPVELPGAQGGGTAVATFTVRLSAPSGRTVTVGYATADGTATQGADYLAAAGTLTFAPGETQKTVSVTVLADGVTEPSETFFVRLANPQYATLAGAEAAGTILDSAAAQPTIAVGDVTVTEGNAGTSSALFTVRLSAASTQPVTVAYTTADGTALANSDYLPVSGTLTFAPGVTALTITVPILGDVLPEATEMFRVVLSQPTNATLAVGQATGTILDNDAVAPAVSVAFKVQDDWGSGFVAAVTITNNQPADIVGWTLEFDFDRDLTNIWNAEIVSHVGTHYVVRAASWDQTIAGQGGSVGFGFQGVTGNVTDGPRNYVLNGVPLG
jgi:endoglucanase